MKRSTLLTISIFLIFPSFLLAQKKEQTKVNMAQALSQPMSPVQNIVGLLGLDPMKFSMSHSYSLSFSSFGGNSYHQGLYLNTMRYQFTDKLSSYFQVGIRHHPFAGKDSQFNNQNQIFVSGAGLKYEPMENMSVQFEFSQQPGYYGTYGSSPYRTSILPPVRPAESTQEDNQN